MLARPLIYQILRLAYVFPFPALILLHFPVIHPSPFQVLTLTLPAFIVPLVAGDRDASELAQSTSPSAKPFMWMVEAVLGGVIVPWNEPDSGSRRFAECYPNASVLFIEIQGFERMTREARPRAAPLWGRAPLLRFCPWLTRARLVP